MLSSQPSVLPDLRVLAGGRGWLVEQALRCAAPDVENEIPLADVVRYLLDWRLEHDDLTPSLRATIEALRCEWSTSPCA